MHVGGVSAPLTVQSTREPDTRCKKKSLPRMDWSIEFVLVSIRSYSWFVAEGHDRHYVACICSCKGYCMNVDMENIEAQHWICIEWRCVVFIWCNSS